MAEELLGGWEEALERLAKPTTDKLAALGIDADTLQSNLAASAQENTEFNSDIRAQSQELDDLGEVTPQTRNYQLDLAIARLQADETPGVTTNMMSNMRRDRKANYERVKNLTHDMSHEGSGEQAIADIFELSEYQNDYPTVLQPEEAHALSKELGIERKFDKPVTEGKVRFEVDKARLHEAREKELAYFLETGDYTSFQNIMIGASALSGAFTGLDLAGVALTSWTGWLASAKVLQGLATVAKTTKNLTGVSQALRLAQKMALMEKKAAACQDAAEAAKESLLINTGMFAADAMVSDMPRLGLKVLDSSIKNDNSFTGKDVVSELMIDGAIGAAIPLAGAGFKTAKNAIFSEAKKEAKMTAQGNAVVEQLKGHEGQAEAVVKDGEEVINTLDKAESEGVSTEAIPAQQNFAENTVSYKAMNLTDAEHSTLFARVWEALRMGDMKSLREVLINLPFRFAYYSNVEGMMDRVVEAAQHGLSGREFFDSVLSKLPLTTRAMTRAEGLEGILDFLKTMEPSFIQVNEKGALGRTGIYGFTPNTTADLDFAIRKALMMDEDEAGVIAGIQAEQQLNKLQRIKELVDEIYNTQSEILRTNQDKSKDLDAIRFRYRDGGQNQFRIEDEAGNVQFTSLEGAIMELSERLLPDDIAKEFKRIEAINQENARLSQLIGHDIESYAAEEGHIQDMYEFFFDWNDKIKAIFTQTSDDGLYLNLRALVGEADTSYMKKFSDVLGEMLESNRSMRNTDFIFEDTYKNKMDDLANNMVAGTHIPEMSYSYEGDAFKQLEPKNLLKDDSEVLGAYETAKQQYAASENENIKQIANELVEFSKNDMKAGKRKEIEGKLPFAKNEEMISKLEEVIDNSFEKMQRNLIDTLQKNSFFKNVAIKVAEATPEKLANLARSYRIQFNKAIETSIAAPLRDVLPQGALPTALLDKINEAGDNLVDMLKAMKQEDINALFEAPEITLSKETPKEVVEQELAKREQQQNIITKLMTPYFKKVSEAVVDYTTSLYADQSRLLKNLKMVIDDAGIGRADEKLMGIPSGDFIPGEGTSLTMENLADARPDKDMLLLRWKKLGEENGHNINTLQQIAEDKSNSPAIIKDLQTLYRKKKGLLSKEEEQAFQANSQTAMIAQGFLDQLQHIADNIYRIGGGRWDFHSLIDPAKLRGDRFLFRQGKKMIGSFTHEVLRDNKIFNKFFEAGDEHITDKLLYFFENLDLDSHFNTNNFSKIGYNELRDALITPTGKGTKAGYEALIKEYGETELKTAMDNLEKSLVGFFNKTITNSIPIPAEKATFRAHYLQEAKAMLRFKSPEAELEAAKYYGYDDFSKMVDANLKKAKKVYSIVKVAGTEPFENLMGLKDMTELYVNNVVPTKYGIEKANKLINRFSKTFEHNFEYMVNKMCGTYSTPAKSWANTIRLIVNALGAPMIMASPIKGVADYSNMFHYIFSAGWHSAKDVGYRLKTLPKLLTLIPRMNNKDTRFLKDMHLMNLVDQEYLYNAFTNGDTLAKGQAIGGTFGTNMKNFLQTIQDIARGKEFTADAPWQLKMEEYIRAWGDLVMHTGRIGESSDINRGWASTMLMRAIADNGDVAFKDLTAQAKQSLKRYGISDWEWDNIFRKHFISNVDDHIAKFNGEGGEYFGDFKIFTPDAVTELDDATIEGFMKANPEKHPVISKESIANYRQELHDKASIIINSGADEMVSIPNERVKAWLRGFSDPNTWTGTAWSTATQYQSFGAMMNWAHWTRRWMSFIDPKDELFTTFALAAGGMRASQFQSFTCMLAEMAIYQGMLLEALSYANGKHQSIYSSDGKVQLDVLLSKKLVKPFIDTSGGVGVLLDALIGAINIGRGQGGGISFPLFPVPSAMIGGFGKVINAGTKESTKGTRAQAVTAQIVQNTLDITGIPRMPVIQAGYTMLIGDRLSEMAQGSASWQRQQARRRRQGYQRNWAYDARDFAEDIFTNR